jgi:S1-C subfamily serine protease
MATHVSTSPPSADDAALDAYSAVITRVAETLLPRVVRLEVRTAERVRGGSGSAVVFTPDGYLLTAAHVVRDARNAVAEFTDGRTRTVEIVGSDPLSDLAVGRIDVGSESVDHATLGESERLRVGQLVVAVGSPLSLGPSVTAGVVSGLGRSLFAGTPQASRVIENVIQTDAALNPGNSGGALANGQAQVVGINTAVAGMGLGLAVPISAGTRQIISALMHEGRVRRAWLGIAGARRQIAPRIARATGYEAGIGVAEVVPGSPAARCGVKSGDVIVEVDGRLVRDAGELQRLMLGEAIGRPMSLRVLRGRTLLDINAVPGEMAA